MAASVVKWEATWNSRGNVMSDTELSALANNAVSSASPEYDNSTNLDQYARLQLDVDFVSAPSAGGFVNVYIAQALDGTNYTNATTVAADVGQFQFICSIFVPAVTAAIKVVSSMFTLPPGKMKFVLENKSGQ